MVNAKTAVMAAKSDLRLNVAPPALWTPLQLVSVNFTPHCARGVSSSTPTVRGDSLMTLKGPKSQREIPATSDRGASSLARWGGCRSVALQRRRGRRVRGCGACGRAWLRMAASGKPMLDHPPLFVPNYVAELPCYSAMRRIRIAKSRGIPSWDS